MAKVNNENKATVDSKRFNEELRNAKCYNSFVLDGEIYFPEDGTKWGSNTYQLYREIMTAMANANFDGLLEAIDGRGNIVYPGIVSEEKLLEIRDQRSRNREGILHDYYDEKPFYTRDGVNYHLYTNKSAKDFLAKIWRCAEKMGFFLEVDYEPEEKKG